MGAEEVADTYVEPAPADLVSFSIVTQPKPGVSIDEIRQRLTLETLREYVAPESVRALVAEQLRSRGFEVFDRLPSPIVSARGTVALFRSVFGGDLVKRIRTVTTDRSRRTVTAIVVRPGAAPPSPQAIDGALLIAVVAPPLFVAPAIPPEMKGFSLRLPGDIAQLTGASATHRLATPNGERATGTGVKVAVIDSGFAPHPYYDQHDYNITRRAAPDTASPDVDAEPHGTAVLAALLVCAPDVDAYGIKAGDNVVLAFDLAMTFPALKIVSISWVYDLALEVDLPFDLVPLWIRILDTISVGVTVVAAGGNGQTAFPAMMPEVIAVGGVAIDTTDALTVWSGASSFASSIFKARNVPDICALASDMLVPIPGHSIAKPDWVSNPGTSFAAPQIGGIAALLLQKKPGLAPDDIRTAITKTARDITAGTTALGHKAAKGPDLATGAGLVSALDAWRVV